MTTHTIGLPRNHPNRERMEEHCCLFASGELSQQELVEFTDHLKACSECRAQTMEFEKLILFELSSASVLRMEHIVPETMDFAGEQELLARIRGRATTLRVRRESQLSVAQQNGAPWATPIWKHAAALSRRAFSWAGWATAAVLLVVLGTNDVQPIREQAVVIERPKGDVALAQLAGLERGVTALQAEKEEAFRKLKEAEASARISQAAFEQLSAQSRDQDAMRAALAAERDGLSAELGQRTAELEIAHKRLNEEINARDAMQEQLADVNIRLEKQRSEVFRLQELAGNTRTSLPLPSTDLSSSEAKEILGARDLHIVDVYDVDDGGKSSKVYGRVYYVNRNLLIFYAFDLSNAQKNRKAVAFQAWGFRQPRSTNAESLGLFYMDNASLNRWALRVSDPQLLSRIDTLFVTLEPLGGSSTPKGQRLLMASLAGPANHP